jgi:hypothetical protein
MNKVVRIGTSVNQTGTYADEYKLINDRGAIDVLKDADLTIFQAVTVTD